MSGRWKGVMGLLVATLLLVCISNATMIDLGAYILSTGDRFITPTFAISSGNETAGDYCALVGYGEGNEGTVITLIKPTDTSPQSVANLTTAGFKPVKHPYPGFLRTNSTDGSVTYSGDVSKNISLLVVCASSQEAINLLKGLQVISREDYQKSKSDELAKALS